MSHIWMSHVTQLVVSSNMPREGDGSCNTYGWVHVTHQMSHVTHMSKSRHICPWVTSQINWVMSHISTSHVTHIHESCHTYQRVMSHSSSSAVTCLERAMSHVTHIDESCHTYGRVMSRIWMSHVTHMDESCHAYGWVMSHIWMSHCKYVNDVANKKSLKCINCRVQCHVVNKMSHVTHIHRSCHTYSWVMSRIWISHVTHVNESF